MKEDGVRFFPKQVDNNFPGFKIADLTFLLIIVVTIVRSLIHLLAPDGGASSIAGINVSVEGGTNIVSIFAFWGLSQLLIGFVYLAVFFRYKSLIPFMYLLLIIEYIGRILLGVVKPLDVSHIPPGTIGNYVVVPLAGIMLILSLKGPEKRVSSGAS